MATAARACGNCSAPLEPLRLAGHYGHTVEVELCSSCHLLWFDGLKPGRLSGPGLLALVGEMAARQSLPHLPARPDLCCPVCRGPLKQVHNRTRWGHSLQLECVVGHGSWQTFGQLLGERGLLRPMSSADRARAVARDGALRCVSCGGAVAQGDEACSWCGTVPALVDVARLAAALDPDAATRGHRVHATPARATGLHCAACGAAQPAEQAWQCVQCEATLVATGLAEAHRAVQALGPALEAHARKPVAHVVQERLAAQQPALDRQRERAAAMQAEADAALGRQEWVEPPERKLWELLPASVKRGLTVALVLVLVLLLALAWWRWH